MIDTTFRQNLILPFVPATLGMVVIFLMSSRPRVPTAGLDPDIVSIAGHFIAFGTLAALIAVALLHLSIRISHAVPLAWLATVLYGIVDEFHQSFVPGRDATGFDVAVDALGATVVLGIVVLITHRRASRE